MKFYNYTHAIPLATLAIALGSSLSAVADEANVLDTIQVTAYRSEIAVEKTLASVTVITREDIEQSQAPDIANILSQQAGIDVVRTGGPGSLVTIFTRGSNSNHTLILIDGIRVNSPVQGGFDFSQLPISLVERIEIVRGPRAALWGSDAIGGVIQIFTRKPKQFVELRAGSYGSASLDAGLATGDADNNLGVMMGYGRATGFSATNENAPFGGFSPDNDGYINRHMLVNGQALLGEQRLSAYALATRADTDFDEGETHQNRFQIGFNLSGNVSGIWNQSLSLNQSNEKLETPIYGNTYGGQLLALDWINTFDFNANSRLIAGVNLSQESGFSEDYGFTSIDETRNNTGLFVSWLGGGPVNSFEFSLRNDDDSQFGNKTTGQAAWGIRFNEDFRFRASWGQGFRAPTFNELYYPGFFGFFKGNPNLKPEQSESAELGLLWDQDAKQHWELSAYSTRITDLIAFEGINFEAVNINKAALDGVEATYQFTGQVFSLNANASWLDASNDITGDKLLRRANRKLNLDGNFQLNPRWTLGLDFQAISERLDFGGTSAGGYGRWDGLVSYQCTADWTIEARIENLLDKDYELVRGYNTPGLSGLVTVRWNAKN